MAANKEWLDLLLSKAHIIDVLEYYRAYASSGGRASPGFDGWVAYRCPINQQHANEDKKPSFSICLEDNGKYRPGAWKCRAGCAGGGGDLASLVEAVCGLPKGHGVVRLSEDFNTGWKAKRGTPAAKVQKSKAAKPLPTVETLRDHFRRLYEKGNEIAGAHLSHLIRERFLKPAVLQNAFVGSYGAAILFPVFDQAKRLLNVREYRTSRKPKMMGVEGRGTQHYPLWLADLDSTLTITEGEVDALTFIGMGVNALTKTGGIDCLTWKHYEQVLRRKDELPPLLIICVDNEGKSRRQAIKFANDCLANGVLKVKIVDLPFKDINDWLKELDGDYEKLTEYWNKLVDETNVLSRDSIVHGLAPSQGCLVKISGPVPEIACKFLGQITKSGKVIDYDGMSTKAHYVVELKHQDGDKLTVEHEDGGMFWRSVMIAARGLGKWRVLERDSDKIFAWISLNSPKQETQDTAWFFGYRGDETDGSFFTKSSIAQRVGQTVANDQVEMRPPPTFRTLDLPVPDKGKCVEAARLLFDGLLSMHDSVATMQVVASALFAPIRRGFENLFLEEPLFTLFLYGRTGTGKTQLALAGQALYGMHREDGMLSFDSTIKSLQVRAASAGDSFVVFDEFPLSASTQVTKTLLAFLKNAQTEGRGTLRSDRSENVVPSINGILCVTSERLPTDDPGQLARALVVQVKRGPIAREKAAFRAVRQAVTTLPYAMSSWLEWMFHVKQAEGLYSDAAGLVEDTIKYVADGVVVQNLNRFERRAIALTMTWQMALGWGKEIGAIDEARADQLLDTWIGDVLPDLFRTNLAIQASSSLSEDFITSVVAALQSGQAKLIGVRGLTVEVPGRDVSHPNALTIGFVAPDETGYNFNGRSVRVYLSNVANEVYRPGDRGSWRGTMEGLKPEWVMESVDPNKNRFRVGPDRQRGHPGTDQLTEELLSPFSMGLEYEPPQTIRLHKPDQRKDQM